MGAIAAVLVLSAMPAGAQTPGALAGGTLPSVRAPVDAPAPSTPPPAAPTIASPAPISQPASRGTASPALVGGRGATTQPVPPAPAATAPEAEPPAGGPAVGAVEAAAAGQAQTAEAVRIALILGIMTLIPAVAICMTPFVRIIVVLSMIRHAFGMPQTPPNQVLIGLAIFITGFVMAPTLTQVNDQALQPFLSGSISVKEALSLGSAPMRSFMLRQVHDQDIKTIYDIARRPLPARAADVGVMELTPAFMLNELRVSFKMGFVIFLPFLLIDLIVSSILLSLGMLMVPPSTISLPIKILMFVLIDGWSLVLQAVAGSVR